MAPHHLQPATPALSKVRRRVAVSLVFLVFMSGCAVKLPRWRSDEWFADYQNAEARAGERDAGMVIFYRDTSPHRPDQMLDATRRAITDGIKRDYVPCVLSKTYAWDRKYVAQFGVDRSPAVIVVHPDGTFHALVGYHNGDGVQEFLSRAGPPGRVPKLNPFLHRRPQYEWLTSLDEGKEAAARTRRAMLVVYYRQWSRDMHELNRMFAEPALYRRIADMVHVRQTSMWNVADQLNTPFGTLQLPAVVIVEQDGGFRALELPRGYDEIIRLADGTKGHDESQATGDPAATSVLGSP